MLSSAIPFVGRLLRSSLYRNAGFIAANTFVTALLGMFFWLVVARGYPDEEAGLAAAIISAATLMALLSTMGFNVGLIRFLPEAGERGEEMVNSCLAISALLAMGLAVGFVAGSGLWAPSLAGIFLDGWAAVAFVGFSAVFVLSSLTDSVFIANRKAVYVLMKNSLHGVLKIVLVVLAVALGALGVFASWSLALMAGVAAGLLVMLPRVMRGFRPVPMIRWGIVRKLFHYSVGNHVGVVFAALPALTLPLLIVNLLPPENGIYFYVAWVIANLLFVIPSSLALSLLAEGSHSQEALGKNLREVLLVALLILVPAIAVVWLVGGSLLAFFGPAYAASGLELLRILVLASLPAAVTSLYVTVLRVEKRVLPLIGLLGFMALFTVGGSYVLLDIAGLPGIGYAYLAAQSLASGYVAVAYGAEKRRKPRQKTR